MTSKYVRYDENLTMDHFRAMNFMPPTKPPNEFGKFMEMAFAGFFYFGPFIIPLILLYLIALPIIRLVKKCKRKDIIEQSTH